MAVFFRDFNPVGNPDFPYVVQQCAPSQGEHPIRGHSQYFRGADEFMPCYGEIPLPGSKGFLRGSPLARRKLILGFLLKPGEGVPYILILVIEEMSDPPAGIFSAG
jgi:hypothetical protein